MKKQLRSLKFGFVALAALSGPQMALAGGAGVELPKQDWAFESIQTPWDKATLKRGYQVATQVCLSCHSFRYIAHRNLSEVGFSENEIKSMATALEMGVNDKIMSSLSDADAVETYAFALPDLSITLRARAGGADYIYSILTGYGEAPEGVHVSEGLSYNKYFPGHQIAMPNPLSDGLVEYSDGTKAGVEQMAKDVAYFMAWASMPELKNSQRLGVYVLLYLLVMGYLLYLVKRRIWRRVKK